MENKPQVFASPKMSEAMKEANSMGDKIAAQANLEDGAIVKEKGNGELSAQEQMNKDSLDNLEAQLKARDELIAKKKAEAQGVEVESVIPNTPLVTYAQPEQKAHKKLDFDDDAKFESLSSPQMDAPYDVIKLPSEGLLYKNGKSALKVAYLNATDENIITNPNLLRSGKFLEVLINRKVLDPNLRYKDLHVGDRNAIMIWLRSTGFGAMYKIKLADPNNDYKEFETDIDLSKLPVKYLSEKPDENGHFTYKLPVADKTVTYRLLTVGDVDDIENHVEVVTEELGPEFVDTSTYTLGKQIVAVDGNYDSEVVKNFVNLGMRLGDVRGFRKHINEIESGIDMAITVETQGGESLDTFLPLNLTFFWPDLGV
jgi:hypothetical protein